MERYSNLYSSPLSIYTSSCPVCIAAGSLLKDNQTGAILAQLKFKSLTPRIIAGLIVAVDAFDLGGSVLDGVEEYSYLDLNLTRDTKFGQKNAILLPNSNTRRISARCKKVFFMDGGVWEAPVDAVWAPLGIPTTLESVLGADLADQYRRDTFSSAQFIPLEQHDLWTCTCGAINRKEEDSCHSCSSLLFSLIAASNEDTLSNHLAEKKERDRIAAEKLAEEQRIAREKAAIKKKKSLKITSIMAAIAVVCTAVFLVVTKVIIPSNDYKAAEALLAAGDYDGAIAAFESLGDYKDASTRVMEARYIKAENLLAAGDCDGAIVVFEALEDYKDASTRAMEIWYTKAESLLISGDYVDAALIFSNLGEYNDSHSRSITIWDALQDKTVIVANGAETAPHTVGLQSDGTVVAVGYNGYGECNVSRWSDIVAIAAGDFHTVGLRADGTVVATGLNDDGECNVSNWTDIIAIAAGGRHTLGLRKDGTVVATGENERGECNVANWSNIVAISVSDAHSVGVRADGTVVAVGFNRFDQCNVSNWKDIVAVVAEDHYTLGLRADGSVIAVGKTASTKSTIKVGAWRDIVAIDSSDDHYVGLRSNGTVVAGGNNSCHQCDVSRWTNIVAVAAGGDYTIGLKADGTVISAGGTNEDGEVNVSKWKDIMIPTV